MNRYEWKRKRKMKRENRERSEKIKRERRESKGENGSTATGLQLSGNWNKSLANCCITQLNGSQL